MSITATEMRDRLLTRLRVRQAYTQINLSLHAGSPMVFGCVDCNGPIWVPEMYVAKPRRCPNCGGEWSRGE